MRARMRGDGKAVLRVACIALFWHSIAYVIRLIDIRAQEKRSLNENFLDPIRTKKNSTPPPFIHAVIKNKPLHMQPPQPAVAPDAAGFALWNLGFRPFYLLASIFSALSVAIWTAESSGFAQFAYLRGPVLHGHEMLFGYTTAVIAGFLLTAVRAWTNQPTPSGAPLAALAALWVCGRILVLTP